MAHDARLPTCPTTGRPLPRVQQAPPGYAPPGYVPPGYAPPTAPRAPHTNAPQHPQPPAYPPPNVRPPAPRPQAAPQARPVSAQPAAQAPNKRTLTGMSIGQKYTVGGVLGEGGMGAVYEAQHVALGRAVAIKVLHPAQAKKKVAVKRFHQEARSAGRIGHPNICEVYDLGTLEDGSPYLVMERLYGETLSSRIAREGGLPVLDVIDIVTQVLSGLDAAHAKGILHRDIKPENVFLTQRLGLPPLVKLLDFGVSKMMFRVVGEPDDEGDLTRTGMVMGTPYYMASEQARGERNLDARVDVYACGVILYESLTGRRPFSGANYNALLLQILTGTPVPANQLVPDLPPEILPIIDKAMARNRDQRYPSAAAFQADLVELAARLRGERMSPASGARSHAPRTSLQPPAAPQPPSVRPAPHQVPAPPPRSNRNSAVQTEPEVPSRRLGPSSSKRIAPAETPIANALSSADVPVVVVEDTDPRRRPSPIPTDELITARMLKPPSGMMEAVDDEVTKVGASPFDEDAQATERIDGEELQRAAQAWAARRQEEAQRTQAAPFGEEEDDDATIVLDSGAIEEVRPAPGGPRRR
jgi:serine/threonine-protein kinase